MLCVASEGLTGLKSMEFVGPLRKLTVYGLAARANNIFSRCFAQGQPQVLSSSHVKAVVEEMSSVRRFGFGQGEPAIIALSETMGFPARYRVALDLASDKNLYTHVPAVMDPRLSTSNFVFWHTGTWHFELGYYGKWSDYVPPMKVGPSAMSNGEYYEYLLDLIQQTREVALMSPYPGIRAAVQDADEWYAHMVDPAHKSKGRRLDRSTEAEYQERLRVYMKKKAGFMVLHIYPLLFMQGWHSNYESRTRQALAAAKVQLDAAGLAKLHTRICAAAEIMWEKVYKHLMEEKEVVVDQLAEGPGGGAGAGGGKKGKAKKKATKEVITEFLDVFQRRKYWDVRSPHKLPSAEPDKIDSALRAATGAEPSADLRRQYRALKGAVDRKDGEALPAELALNLPVPGADGKPADISAVATFWRAVERYQQVDDTGRSVRPYNLVGCEALKSLSIPISQTIAERSFSTLSNREEHNRLLAGDRYVANLVTLSCNRPYLLELNKQRIDELLAALKI